MQETPWKRRPLARLCALVAIVFLSVQASPYALAREGAVKAPVSLGQSVSPPARPNIVLFLADDLGWTETSYMQHPTVRTPQLDAMVQNGLVFRRFYSAAPTCSPTRAALLTGRSNDRTGVLDYGYRLRHEERTIAEILQDAGYATGHFGKWHLSGIEGPGVPVLYDDPYGPRTMGFSRWVSSTNYFETNPVLSDQGVVRNYRGDSSEVLAAEAIKFMEESAGAGKPFFAAIWLSSPHVPYISDYAGEFADADLPEAMKAQHGEIFGMDKALGKVRAYLSETGLSDRTILWFQSDNGPAGRTGEEAHRGLTGRKGMLREGGVRVPSVVEWPGVISPGSAVSTPVSSYDFPLTMARLAGVGREAFPYPLDGADISEALLGRGFERGAPLFFRRKKSFAVIDGDMKLFIKDRGTGAFELHDLSLDPAEQIDLSQSDPQTFERLMALGEAWNRSVDRSLQGLDYGEEVLPEPRGPLYYYEDPQYRKLSRIMAVRFENTVWLSEIVKDTRVQAIMAALAFAGLMLGALAMRLFSRRRAG